MTIDQKLAEISDYFKSRILQGDFKLVETNSTGTQLLIDNEDIHLWHMLDCDDFQFLNGYLQKSGKRGFLTKKEKIAGFHAIKPHIIKFLKEKLEKEKRYNINETEERIKKLEEL